MNSGPDVAENLAFITASLRAEPDLDLLLLPENAVQMPATRDHQYVEPATGGEVQRALSRLAADTGTAIVLGALAVLVEPNPKPFARSLLFDQQGRLCHTYDKLHLFDVDTGDSRQHRYRESETYQAGPLTQAQASPKALTIGDLSVQLGLSICYDLRFPEMYRALVQRGAQILCVPAAFTYETGQAHWATLLRARAIENQVYVLAAAQHGIHANGRQTWGHSMIVDPWGEVIVQQNTGQGLVSATLDLTKIESLKASFPVQQHRRL
ncbi:amidohydrolase [Arenicella chitinivorans]|uniref:Amidohydrolase n=2 Tax=Arenicella chitinivorans TaxID=1329800 RepID=A0A918RUT9_9GAMM|nr:amidohydrolase [Arenicella chitinivorans]